MKTVISVFIADLHLWSLLHDHDALLTFLDKVYELIKQYKRNIEIHFYMIGDILSGADIYGKFYGEQAYDEALPAVSTQTLSAGYFFYKVNEKIKEITGKDTHFHILRGTHEKRRGENYAWQLVTELQALGLRANYLGLWSVVQVAKDHDVFVWHSTGGSAIGISPRAIQDSLIAVAERVREYPNVKDVIVAHRHASGEVGMTHAFRVIQLGGFQQFWKRPVQRQMGGYVYVSKNGKLVYDGHIRVEPTMDPMLDIHNRVRFSKIFQEACEFALAKGRISHHEIEPVFESEIPETLIAKQSYETVSDSCKELVNLVYKHVRKTDQTIFNVNVLSKYFDKKKYNKSFKAWINAALHLDQRRRGEYTPRFRINNLLRPIGINLEWDKRRQVTIVKVNKELLSALSDVIDKNKM